MGKNTSNVGFYTITTRRRTIFTELNRDISMTYYRCMPNKAGVIRANITFIITKWTMSLLALVDGVMVQSHQSHLYLYVT